MAAAFAKKLGTDASSDFQRHHRQRKPSSRIDKNPSTPVTLNLESYYRKEFKAVLDTQISTFKDVLENCVTTIKPLVYALQQKKIFTPDLRSFSEVPSEPRPFVGKIEPCTLKRIVFATPLDGGLFKVH